MDTPITKEKGVSVGDVRLINETLHYACHIHKQPFRTPEVLWKKVENKHLG